MTECSQRGVGAGFLGSVTDLVCQRTGGPCRYAGRDMASAHEGMNIRDDEFDALVEDLVKAIDAMKAADADKRELIAIVRQMRGAVVGH